MKQPGFTLGPWEASRAYKSSNFGDYAARIIARDERGRATIAKVYGGNFDDKEHAEINAHLMAAAPDMYEALKRLTQYGDIFRYKNGESNPYEQAISALAKAEGRIVEKQKEELVSIGEIAKDLFGPDYDEGG